MGLAYEYGRGVDVNIVEAMRYYRLAAAGGGDVPAIVTRAAAKILALKDAYKEEVSKWSFVHYE